MNIKDFKNFFDIIKILVIFAKICNPSFMYSNIRVRDGDPYLFMYSNWPEVGSISVTHTVYARFVKNMSNSSKLILSLILIWSHFPSSTHTSMSQEYSTITHYTPFFAEKRSDKTLGVWASTVSTSNEELYPTSTRNFKKKFF